MLGRPYRRLGIITVAGLAAGLAEAGVIVIVVRVAVAIATDTTTAIQLPLVTHPPSTPILLWMAAGMTFVALVMHLLLAHFTARLSSEILVTVRNRAIDAFGRADWERQAAQRDGALQQTVSVLAGNSAQLANVFAIGISSLLSLIMLVAAAAVVDPLAMVVVAAFGGLMSLSFRPLAHITRRRSRAFVNSTNRFAEDVSRMTTMAMELRVFGVQEQASSELRAAVDRTADDAYRMRVVQRLGWALYSDVAMMFVVSALGVLYLIATDALIGAGTVVILVLRALNSAQTVQRNLQTINELGPNLDALVEHLKVLEAAAPAPGDRPLDEIKSIELVRVTYEYVPGDGALRDVDLRIAPGEVLGVVGPSGGGKSTLVQVLLRLRMPRSGLVLVNGVPYQDHRDGDWTRLVTLVPQEPRLMEASIAENIRFFRPGISDEQVRAAARAAHVETEMIAQPHGFDTVLGPRGSGLSGGQKQRLAIARALVGNPAVIVLDEPTSALDAESERHIQDTIRELKGTVTFVIVAHRATTLALCDRLVVVRNGSSEQVASLIDLPPDVLPDVLPDPTARPLAT